jgi:hypothetical protein
MDTNQFLINKILNKHNSYYVMIIMFIFVFYLIVQHIFDLTKMVYTYNSAKDYGTFLQKLCVKEYFEYETARYQVAINENEIQLNNDNNKGAYMTFILVITIIVSLIISIIFSYIVYNTFFNQHYLYKITGIDANGYLCMKKENIIPSGFMNRLQYAGLWLLCILQTIIVNPFYVLIYAFKKLLITKQGDEEGRTWSLWFKNLAFIIFIILVYVIIAFVLVLIPIYIGLKVSDKDDISPFSNKKIGVAGSEINVYVLYVILFSLIVIMRFAYNVFYNYFESDVSSWHLTEYLTDNAKNLYITNNVSGYITFFVCMALYIVIFFVLGNVINIYRNYTSYNITEEDTDTESDNSNMYIRENIIDIFMNNVLGYKEYNQFTIQHILLKKLSGITFVVFIIICVMFAVSYICNNIGTNINVSNLLQYGIILPLLVLLIVLFATKNMTEYNTIVNKYIVKEPIRLYKQYANNVHNMFNKIVAKEYVDTSYASAYVCRNVGNGILLTLYSNLFKGIGKVNRDGFEDDTIDKYIDITPEFTFEQQCDSSRPFDYTNKDLKEYMIDYYINGKTNGKSIFYTFTNCSLINSSVLKKIGINLTEMFTSEQLKSIISQINEQFYGLEDSKLKTTEPMQYIKQEIIMKSQDIKDSLKNYTEKLKKQLHESIYNINNNNVYYNSELRYIYYNKETNSYYTYDVDNKNKKVSLNVYEVNNNNNKLMDDNLRQATNDHLISGYNMIVNKVIDLYIGLIYYNLYIFTPLWINVNAANVGSTENFDIYQDDYIRLLTQNMKDTFNNINKDLSTSYDNLKNDKLTKYIISNYNNINNDKIYTKNTFEAVIPELSKEGTSEVDIQNDVKVYYKYLKDLMKIYENIKILVKDFEINQHKSAIFVATLYDSKYNIETYIGNFESYAKNRNNQDIEIDKELFKKNLDRIFRIDNEYKDQYLFIYSEYKTSKYNVTSETKIVSKNMYDMTVAMMKLCKITLNNINDKYNTLNNNNISEIDNNLLGKYTDNIKSYISILNKNINGLNNDYLNYMNKLNLQNDSNLINSDYLSMDMSKNLSNDACITDKLIYLVIVNYIIALIFTKFIHM